MHRLSRIVSRGSQSIQSASVGVAASTAPKRCINALVNRRPQQQVAAVARNMTTASNCVRGPTRALPRNVLSQSPQVSSILNTFFSQSTQFHTQSIVANETPVAAPQQPDVKTVPPHLQKIVDEILKLNIVEAQFLAKSLQAALGISDEDIRPTVAAAPVAAVAAAPAAGAAPAAAEAKKEEKKEQTIFSIKLVKFNANDKIKIIKEVRTITGLGLKESKELVERAPVVLKEELPKADAEKLAKLVKDAGGEVELV